MTRIDLLVPLSSLVLIYVHPLVVRSAISLPCLVEGRVVEKIANTHVPSLFHRRFSERLHCTRYDIFYQGESSRGHDVLSHVHGLYL